MMIAVLVVSSVTFAQEKAPKFLEEDGIVKVTFYHDNGQIQQEGYYSDGKLEGKWIAFDQNGVKVALGTYSNGIKTGSWYYWTKDGLSEVDYSKTAILSIKKWTHGTLALLD